jgi:NADH-quinone oxidoreductase subunit L
VHHPDTELGIANVGPSEHAVHAAHWPNLAVTFIAAVAGIAYAFVRYGKGGNVPDPEKCTSPLYKASLNKFYVDEIYDMLVVFPFSVLSELLHWVADVLIIDGLVGGAAELVKYLSGKLRRIQTGVLSTYAFGILCGTLALLVYLFVNWK